MKKNAAEYEVKLTREQADDELSVLRRMFKEVSLVDASSFQELDEASLAAQVLREKCQKTRLEYVGSELNETVARYVEIDDVPHILKFSLTVEGDLLQTKKTESNEENAGNIYSTLYTDALTGVYNRRYYEDRIKRLPVTGGVAMIDLDDFKLVNDIYGHDAGDMILAATAAIIRRRIRRDDALIRFGGDEFILVMPGISDEMFDRKLDEICKRLHQEKLPESMGFQISVSMGGLVVKEQTVELAVLQADKLMYQAKVKKNMIVTEWRRYQAESMELQEENLGEERPLILIVDDSLINRTILKEMLQDNYDILEAGDGAEGLGALSRYGKSIALVLLDIMMPVMDGFGVLEKMQEQGWINDIPVIMISSEDSADLISRAYAMGVSDYISRPFDASVVYKRVYNTIKLYAKQRRLVNILTEQVREKEENRKIMVGILSEIVEFRNGESGLHVQHINVLTEMLLERLTKLTDRYSLTRAERDQIVMASSLHDIGKIGIDEKILNKPGRLTAEETEVMKQHTLIGAGILKRLKPYQEEPLVKTAYQICRWHHERYDGQGYPDGRKGEEIPISAQVVSLADAYDALVSERVYKKAFSHEKALEMILNGECGAYNPILLQCLKDIHGDIRSTVYEVHHSEAAEDESMPENFGGHLNGSVLR